MIIIYGYDDGSCPACNELKDLFNRCNMEFRFITVPKVIHCFKSVPQTFHEVSHEYLGDHTKWRSILK